MLLKKNELSTGCCCCCCCCCFILNSLLTLNPAFLCFAWITNNKVLTTRINAAAAATKIQNSKETLEEGEVSPEVKRNDNES